MQQFNFLNLFYTIDFGRRHMITKGMLIKPLRLVALQEIKEGWMYILFFNKK